MNDQPTVEQYHNNVKIDKFIKDSLYEYSTDIVRSTFPSPIDGLKRVQFRFVYIAHLYPTIQDTTSKIAIVVGHIRELHPHGDVPIYEALVNLSQPWVTDPPLVFIDGNSGTYQGDKPANARYPEIAITDYTYDVFLKGVNFDNIPDVLGDSYLPEPKHLIPALPQALLMSSFSIGCGYQSKTVSLNFANVCDLVKIKVNSINNNKEINWGKYTELFLPDFPTYGYLLNEKELLEEYKKENFTAKIHLEGKYTLSKDRIIIHSFPYGVDFGNMIEQIKTDLNTKNSYLDKVIDDIIPGDFKDLKDGMYIVKIKRTVNVFTVYMHLKNKYKLAGTYVPKPNYSMFNEVMYTLNYIQILDVWLKHRIALMKTMKNDELRRLNGKILEADAVIKVLLNKERFIELTNKYLSIEDITPILKKEFDISGYQVQVLMSKPLSSLLSKSISLLTEQLNKYKTTLDSVYKSVANVPLEISDNAQQLKKKYSKKRSTVLPHYLGYAKVGIGYIQFETMDEIQEIFDNFPKTQISVYKYNYTGYKVFLDNNAKTLVQKEQLDTKYGIGDILCFKRDPFNDKSLKTVKIQNKLVCYSDDVSYNTPIDNYIYSTNKAILITQKGKVYIDNISDKLALRKDIDSANGVTSNIIHVHPYTENPIYIFTLSDIDKNIVWINKIDNTTKTVYLPVGSELSIFSTQDSTDIFVNITEKYRTRNTTQVLHIKDIERLLKESNSCKLDINVTSTKKDTNINLL